MGAVPGGRETVGSVANRGKDGANETAWNNAGEMRGSPRHCRDLVFTGELVCERQEQVLGARLDELIEKK